MQIIIILDTKFYITFKYTEYFNYKEYIPLILYRFLLLMLETLLACFITLQSSFVRAWTLNYPRDLSFDLCADLTVESTVDLLFFLIDHP